LNVVEIIEEVLLKYDHRHYDEYFKAEAIVRELTINGYEVIKNG